MVHFNVAWCWDQEQVEFFATGWPSGTKSADSLAQKELPKSKLEVWKKWAQAMPLQALPLLDQMFPP